jgi:hypothetical protein
MIFCNNWTEPIDFNCDIISETKKWTFTDSMLNYANRGNKKYNLNSIKYETNKHNFRISSSLKYKNGSKKIACFGCSQTFGEGLPWEETWPFLLNENLGEDWIVKNYGICGASNDTISRLVYKYLIDNKPDVICCFFPEMMRLDFFEYAKPITFYPNGFNTSPKIYEAYKIMANFDYCLDNFLKNCKFIEMLCKTKNIKFYWHTWAGFICSLTKDEMCEFFDYECFLSDLKNHFITNPIEFARDNYHLGKNTNLELAYHFSKKILNKPITEQKDKNLQNNKNKININIIDRFIMALKKKYHSIKIKNNDRFVY